MLMELQKVRRQMELCEGRMTLKNLLLADQGSTHHITVKINELKVGVQVLFCPIPALFVYLQINLKTSWFKYRQEALISKKWKLVLLLAGFPFFFPMLPNL